MVKPRLETPAQINIDKRNTNIKNYWLIFFLFYSDEWNESKWKRNTRSDSWIICFLLYSGADIASQSRHKERLFHVAATLCHNIEMAQRAFVALWVIFVLLNGLAAFVVFGCLELFLFRFPFCELSLTLFALVVYHNVGKESASDAFDGVLRNVGVVDDLFTSTQEFLLRMLVVEFEGVLGVFGVCVRHQSFRFVYEKSRPCVKQKLV